MKKETEPGLKGFTMDSDQMRKDLKSIFFINDLTYSQIAELTGLSYTTIRNFLFDGRTIRIQCMYKLKEYIDRQMEANAGSETVIEIVTPQETPNKRKYTTKSNKFEPKLSKFKCNVINK